MSTKPTMSHDWVEASGLPHLVRVFVLAIHPPVVILATLGVVTTALWGFCLDTLRPGEGIGPEAIPVYEATRDIGREYVAPEGGRGVFGVFAASTSEAIVEGLAAVLPPSVSWERAARSCERVFSGVGWMLTQHAWYSLLFFVPMLLLWSFLGGAICRIAGAHFALGTPATLPDALSFARDKLPMGLFLAPCIPLVFVGLLSLGLALFGVVLRFPLLGDLIAGPLFFIAMLGGVLLVALTAAVSVGGWLLWPSVAVESSDAFDAFSRSLAYAFSRVWKTAIYASILLVFAAAFWGVFRWLISTGLRMTAVIVGFGTSPWGWWARSDGDGSVSKLALLWPEATMTGFGTFPDWSALSGTEHVSGACISVFVALSLAILWALLISFALSGSTIMYFLLRRDVDGHALTEIAPDGGEAFEPVAPAGS